MNDAAYFARLLRIEDARCAAHRDHGYGGAFGASCRDCAAAQLDALRFQRIQRVAVERDAIDERRAIFRGEQIQVGVVS